MSVSPLLHTVFFFLMKPGYLLLVQMSTYFTAVRRGIFKAFIKTASNRVSSGITAKVRITADIYFYGDSQ